MESNSVLEFANPALLESFALQSTASIATSIKVDFVTADSIGISYTTIPGNQPNTYGNFIALWQNSDSSIPWNTAPLTVFAVPTNTPNGSFVFSGLSVTNSSYVIGYAVGPILSTGNAQSNGNICATAFIPAIGAGPVTTFNPALTIVNVGVNSVAVSYTLPDGNMPNSNAAWVGIWRSGSPSYNNPPDAFVPVTLNAPNGTVAINGLTIGRGLTYTVAFFMSGYKSAVGPNGQTAIASYISFTNS
jgi:hypothetical protein